MSDLQWAFWNYGLVDLILAAGQFILAVSAFLLAAKHAVWFWRGRHKRERRNRRCLRAKAELVVATSVFGLYAHQLITGGPLSELDNVGAALQVWAFATLLAVLVATRRDDKPH